MRSINALMVTLLVAGCTIKWDVPKVPRYNARTGQCEEGYVYLPPHNDVKASSKVVDCTRHRDSNDDNRMRNDERDAGSTGTGLGDWYRTQGNLGPSAPNRKEKQ